MAHYQVSCNIRHGERLNLTILFKGIFNIFSTSHLILHREGADKHIMIYIKDLIKFCHQSWGIQHSEGATPTSIHHSSHLNAKTEVGQVKWGLSVWVSVDVFNSHHDNNDDDDDDDENENENKNKNNNNNNNYNYNWTTQKMPRDPSFATVDCARKGNSKLFEA